MRPALRPQARPDSASGLTQRRLCWWRPATIRNGCIPRRPGLTCAVSPRFRLTPAGTPDTCAGTRVAIARPSALWRIAMNRIAHDPGTTHYFDRRVKEGRTKRDVIRILQRYIAREVYRYLPRG